MQFESILPGYLPPGAVSEIRRSLAQKGIAILTEIARAAQAEAVSPGAARWLIAVNRLMGSDLERALAAVSHWSTAFFAPALAGGAAAGVLLSNLLFESMANGESPLAGLTFTVSCGAEGRFPVLLRDAGLRVRACELQLAQLTWTCSARSARVQPEDERYPAIEVELPLRADDPRIEYVPYPRSAACGMPVIDDARHALMLDDLPGIVDGAGSRTVASSIDAAHRMVDAVWPEAVGWVEALIPAIADIGPSPSSTTHLSGSYDAGLPVYLSRVDEPWFHAEDLIHELQHQRFHFAISPAWFGRWSDGGFVSPYRTDPRPLSGLHLGLHAFVAVNEFRLRHLSREAGSAASIRELLRTHRQNLFVYRTVMQAERFSAEGARFYSEMARVLSDQAEAIERFAPAETAAAVEASLARHAARAAEGAMAENREISFGAAIPGELARHYIDSEHGQDGAPARNTAAAPGGAV